MKQETVEMLMASIVQMKKSKEPLEDALKRAKDDAKQLEQGIEEIDRRVAAMESDLTDVAEEMITKAREYVARMVR